MSRKVDQDLVEWSNGKALKPLLIRGARQVGKSSAVRNLALRFDYFLEVNFEEQRQVYQLFEGNLNPQELCQNLSIVYDTPIEPGKTLLFFDEIQACLPAISSLRFFYEKMPDLHVIAAGSLLEFALAELPSFGVGRIRSLFMYPLSLDEFLIAVGEGRLLDAKQQATPERPLTQLLHLRLLDLTRRFLMMGGMPEVVSSYITTKDLRQCNQILDDLITSLKSDFSKYKKQVPSIRISEVFDSIVQQSGQRFVYAQAATEANHKQVKEAVDLLSMAGIVIPVTHTAANGIPPGAEINPKKRKLMLLDTGIFQRLLGLDITDVLFGKEFDLVNKGAIAEQFVGLELLKYSSCNRQEALYFWHREAKSSNAEVDYIVQKNQKIFPVEVKSGTKGSMQSLFLFLSEKKIDTGYRFSLENFSSYDKIRVFPLYAVSNWMRQE